MLIALDAMGGDRGAGEIVCAAAEAVRTLGVEVALVGAPDILGAELQRSGALTPQLSIVPAEDSIDMKESPLQAVRRKRQSSIVVGLGLVKSGRADAFVSAGNTGAVMAGATLLLGRLAGVERPALGGVFPARDGRRILLLDVGANADCRPSQLVQFAVLGQAYVHQLLAIARPRVGLVSIGEEDSKGSQLVLEANERLRASAGINFIGNVILKTAEGAAEFILRELRDGLSARLQYKVAASFLRPAFARLRKRLDYAEYGGAPLLGVRGIVIIAHGRSDARAITNAIRVARDGAVSGVLADMGAAITC